MNSERVYPQWPEHCRNLAEQRFARTNVRRNTIRGRRVTPVVDQAGSVAAGRSHND